MLLKKVQDITPTCFGKNIPSSGNVEKTANDINKIP
jgi:hypothetical protein